MLKFTAYFAINGDNTTYYAPNGTVHDAVYTSVVNIVAYRNESNATATPLSLDGGTPDWVNTTLGTAGATAEFFELAYLQDSKQVYKYAERVNGKIRSAETITRANRISSMTTAKYLGYAGKTLGIYGALNSGAELINDPSNPANWIKFGASVGILFMKANPFGFVVSVGYTLLDEGGYIDDWIGNKP